MLSWLGWPFPTSSIAKWCAVPLVLLAFLGRRQRQAALLGIVLTGLGGAYIAADQLLRLRDGGGRAGVIYVAAGLVVAGLAIGWVAQSKRRSSPLDPVVVIAGQLGVALIAHWLYDLVSGEGLNPNSYSPENWGTPFAAELPDLALGLAGVGLMVYRSPRISLNRLGLTRPTSWHIAAGLIAALATLGVAGLANGLTFFLTRHSYEAIEAVAAKTSGQTPIEIALVYAVLAGIAEETLFRGALQPRVGIVIAAVLFTMIHVQYGLTPILGGVFVSGLVYGWLRQRMNTTSAIVAHGMHDALPLVFGATGVFLGWVAVSIVIALLGIRSENERWPRSVWTLAGAALLIIAGSTATFVGLNDVAWKVGALAACAAMSAAILVEARGLKTLPVVAGGIAGWLAIALIVGWEPVVGAALYVAFGIATLLGIFCWYSLARERDPGVAEVSQ